MKMIYVIVGDNYTKDMVVEELTAEGYYYNFYFAKDSMNVINMSIADEVWTFGNVIGNPEYERAISMGKDIWNMG